MKKKSAPQPVAQSPVETQALQTSTDQQNQANQTTATAKEGLSPYLAGSSGMSEFRRALTGNLATSTANTGDNALARMREHAASAGFGGGGQPITFGAENELGNEQAGRIAQIPAEVEQQAAPLELQAAGTEAGIAGREASNAQGYFSNANADEQQRQQDYMQQLQQQRQKKAGIWGALAKVGLGAASAIPGVGPFAAAAGSMVR